MLQLYQNMIPLRLLHERFAEFFESKIINLRRGLSSTDHYPTIMNLSLEKGVIICILIDLTVTFF